MPATLRRPLVLALLVGLAASLPAQGAAANPFALTGDGFLPYPSLHFTKKDPRSPTGVRLHYRSGDFESPDGPLPLELAMWNEADGVSPLTPALVNFGVDVAPEFLHGWEQQEATVEPGAPIALVDAETGEPVPILTEMDRTNRHLRKYAGRHSLVVRPLAPMQMGRRYAVVLTTALRDAGGNELPRPESFLALRDGVRTRDRTVERMRARFEKLFAVLEKAGWPRAELLLTWDFQVASQEYVLGPIRSMRERTLELNRKEGVPYTIDSVDVDPNENVAVLVKGSFAPPNFLDAEHVVRRDERGRAVLQKESREYPFTMIVPPVARERGRLPLVLFGHGLFGTGRGFLSGGIGRSIVQPLAAGNGAVMIATDWIGLSGGDLNLILTEVVPDLSRIRLVTDRLLQSQVNNLSLVELALGALQKDHSLRLRGREPLLDPTAVYYYGVSLGGIQGASQVSINPRIRRAVLAVPGAGWANMIQRSTQFRPIEAVIDQRYPDPLSQTLFATMLQTFFDTSDPGNLGTLLEDKPVLLQQAIGDCQVPNMATDLLARALHAVHLEVAPRPIFGLDVVPGPVTGVAVTQYVVPHLLESFFPPDENTIPVRDNDVHNQAVMHETAFAQMLHVFMKGELVHLCQEACDPN